VNLLSDDSGSELNQIIRKFALQNALLHSGKADPNAVLGKLMAERPELRAKAKELLNEINEIVSEINSMTESDQHSELEVLAPELLEHKKTEKHLILPELPNLDKYESIVMRFAPGPSGPLHIGHTRAVVLNDEYVKRYSGKFIIRFEDTNPQNIDPEAYDLILEDLDWLGIKYHETVKQSDRFEIYYRWASELIKLGHAYVCRCPVEDWRALKENNQPCPDRTLPPDEHLEHWAKMLSREYNPGEVSLIIKTDLNHPNPAVRDFVAFRMLDQPHPLTKDKFYVYPTYNFSVAIDDHLMGMTHILRGKDHLNNTYRQRYIYDYLGWPQPEFHHYGWVSLPKVILKTSIIKDGIREGKYQGWSDIQLGTLQALARRGIRPEAIRKFWLDVGIKEVDITFSWETLYAMNKDLIDQSTDRYFFVWDPVSLVITDVEELKGVAPLHPDDPNRGMRETVLKVETNADQNADTPTDPKGIKVYITREDLNDLAVGNKVRLKDLCNIELTIIAPDQTSIGKFIGNDLGILKTGAKIIHWVPGIEKFSAKIYKPDGEVQTGYCEPAIVDALDKFVQFERYGFVQLGSSTDPVTAWFAHK
jgi:glutamyl-tRNA synthetase